MKGFIKSCLPPIVLLIFKGKPRYGFFGDYNSWSHAQADSKGYDSPAILEKVRASLLKIKNGEAIYERDSVIFDHKEHSWPVLASLLWISSKNGGQLNVLDFGGSLGSSYFQNRDFLKHISRLRWNIVEQENFVKAGREDFENEQLKFYSSMETCLLSGKPDVMLASSVIQYLEKPYEFLELAIASDFEYIIFDRTTFLPNRDRLTVQKVRPGIYDASYPAWFLNEKIFLEIMAGKYELVAELDSLRKKITLEGETASEKGFLFKKR